MRPFQRPQAGVGRAVDAQTEIRGTRQIQISGRNVEQLQLRCFPGELSIYLQIIQLNKVVIVFIRFT